jgi:anaerobic magnesium-protoporphyrin IX monomethyl ester cyclase
VALLEQTNWRTISLGLESGSDPVLRILNKECNEEDNDFAIDLINSVGRQMSANGRTPPVIFANIMLAIPGESEADARKTVAMVNRIHRAKLSLSYFAPYPGSILGYQTIAEGKSLMTAANYHRYPGRETVRGIDYKFYNDLLLKIDGYRDAKPAMKFVAEVYDSFFSKALGETR